MDLVFLFPALSEMLVTVSRTWNTRPKTVPFYLYYHQYWQGPESISNEYVTRWHEYVIGIELTSFEVILTYYGMILFDPSRRLITCHSSCVTVHGGMIQDYSVFALLLLALLILALLLLALLLLALSWFWYWCWFIWWLKLFHKKTINFVYFWPFWMILICGYNSTGDPYLFRG